MLKKTKGFTFIEVLLVLFFIGIFMAMTFNFVLRNKDRWALRDTTREITSTYYQAKQRASRENASMRLEIAANEYTYYRDNNGAWEALKHEDMPEKVTASAIADFVINPMGFILNLDNSISNTRTITLETPRGSTKDTMTITIYPYGGLRVEKVFK